VTKVVCEVRMDRVLSRKLIRSNVETHSRSNFNAARLRPRQAVRSSRLDSPQCLWCGRWRGFRSAQRCDTANPNAKDLWSSHDVFPCELVRAHRFHLSVQGNRIVIIDQYERFSNLESIELRKYQRMTLEALYVAQVQFLICFSIGEDCSFVFD